ncbi:MAG: hypothetical protein RLZZ230_44 [Candidatus Parcubacteria bacterium]|jgi:hypothetical protein
MSHQTKFTELAKSILKHKSVMVAPRIMHPTREWGIGLVIACLIFGASAIWNIQTYNKFDGDLTSTQVVVNTSADKYKAALIEEALATLKEQSVKYNNLVLNAKPVSSVEVTVEPEVVSPVVEDVSASMPVVETTGASSSESVTGDISSSSPDFIEVIPVIKSQ